VATRRSRLRAEIGISVTGRRGNATRHPTRIILRLAVCAIACTLALSPARAASAIFVFHTDEFWLNLHHFLYVLGRADAKLPDASRDAVAGAPADANRVLERLGADEHHAWDEAVTFYANGPSRKDAIFDEPLPEVTRTLAEAGDRAQLADLPSLSPAWRATLLRVAPLYRSGWWPAHRAANVARRDAIQALVDRHGAAVLAFITRAYGMEWPDAGYPVHFSGWANWAGAYSTTGNLLVMSSLDTSTSGFDGLEIAFHEGMHQWDRAMNDLLFSEARRANRRLPPNVSHALIFYTAGAAVQRVAPGHVPYADAYGVWTRGYDRLKPALDEVWKAYLDGTGTRSDAIAALVERIAVP
jgi:hypothetical protein